MRANFALGTLFFLPLILLGISLSQPNIIETLFVHGAYYCLFILVLSWIAVQLIRVPAYPAWWAYIQEHRIGILIAGVLAALAIFAVEPALRILADETNLLGTSKNLFFSQKASFSLSGKWYYDNFWELSSVIDRRPALFPFLVNLQHSVLGYSYRNPFHLNALFYPIFLFAAYRLGHVLAGRTYAIAATLLVSAHPIFLMTVRSGGFDFLATAFSLFILTSFYDHLRAPSAGRLAVLWMNLCMFVEIRYESGLFVFPVLGMLGLFRLIRWEYLRPYRVIYALTPVYFLPRIWQAVLRGNVPEQDPGTITFSLGNFLGNVWDYFRVIRSPFNLQQPHSALIIGLGVLGCIVWIQGRWKLMTTKPRSSVELRFATMVLVWMVCQFIILFSYVWGRPQHPASARLILPVDVFFSYAAAWMLYQALQKVRSLIPILVCCALFFMSIPAAAEGRFLNQLTLIRQASAQWKFFERLGEKRILIITDRPGLFTVMNYGTMDFPAAKSGHPLLHELSRRLFVDLYVIQEIDLTTHKPKPAFEIWPETPKVALYEFQNDANTVIRISKIQR
jgi:hypothetical protein